jgi:hypothetical protein
MTTETENTKPAPALTAAAGSRPDHPRADEIHPLTKLPTGYQWMEHGEPIREGCKYVKLDSPKWHDVTKTGDEYSVFGFHPMAKPIHLENTEVSHGVRHERH